MTNYNIIPWYATPILVSNQTQTTLLDPSKEKK